MKGEEEKGKKRKQRTEWRKASGISLMMRKLIRERDEYILTE